MEDIALAEGIRLLEHAGESVVCSETEIAGFPPGCVLWECASERSPVSWLEHNPLSVARTLYHVYSHAVAVAWDGRLLSSLLEGVAQFDASYVAETRSFRVSCERNGTHSFHSPDVERAAGTLLHERFGTPAQMQGYALHVGIEIEDDRAFIGYRLTGKKGLDRRYRWMYHPRVTLRTPIAYLMLERSGFTQRPGALYDPCSGSGTILLEAGAVAAANRCDVALAGSDREPASVTGARENCAANDTDATISRIDLNELRPRLAPHSLDYIITNPPYGVRLGKQVDYHLLYQSLLSVAVHALRPGGKLALLVERRGNAFDDVRASFPRLQEIETRELVLGQLRPRLIVLERRDRES
jgi:putative N6-adenine-specific DNA methylase/tRNA (guanine6-N2)-methyltransferase